MYCFSPLYNGALNEGRPGNTHPLANPRSFSPLYNGALNEGRCASRPGEDEHGFSPLYNGALNEGPRALKLVGGP